MPTIDIVILVILFVAIIKGLMDGFIKQIAGILGLILGIYLSYKFSSLLSVWLNNWINVSESIVKIISFAIISIAAIIGIAFLGKIVQKIVNITTLGWLNRLVGVLFAIFTTILILGILFSLIHYINDAWFTIISNEKLSESKFVDVFIKITDTVFPYLKNFFKLS